MDIILAFEISKIFPSLEWISVVTLARVFCYSCLWFVCSSHASFSNRIVWFLTPRFLMRQIGAFRSLRSNCTRLRDLRMSWIVSIFRTSIFVLEKVINEQPFCIRFLLKKQKHFVIFRCSLKTISNNFKLNFRHSKPKFVRFGCREIF